MEQYLQGSPINNDLKSLTSSFDEAETRSSVGLECNICLDLAQDPVVTFCGHLFCWPCIYRWISFHNENPDHENPQCPVCKSEVSEKMLIPLYGRGQTTSSSKDELSRLIPQRPPSPKCRDLMLQRNTTNNRSYPYHQNDAQDYNHAVSPMLSRGGSSTHLADPMIGMFGEFVYARIFGNSETTLYTYPNSYHLAGSSSPRLRRHMMETDKSLSRVCFFLCCCMILCLLLF